MKFLVDPSGAVRLVLWFVLLAIGGPSAAQGAAYIKFEGVDGESLSQGYYDWSDLESVNHLITREADPETGQLGLADLKDISCTKLLDKASPLLARAVAMGSVFATVEIHLTRNSAVPGEAQVPYLKYKLEDVRVSSYSLNGSANFNAVNLEALSLNFERITMTYIEFDLDGNEVDTVEFTWNKLAGAP
jgi:type VI secretion system Hcp family effector